MGTISSILGYSPWDHEESDTTEHVHTHTHTHTHKEEETPELSFSPPCEDTARKQLSASLTRTRPCWHPDLRNFEKINFGWLSHPVCDFFVMAVQDDSECGSLSWPVRSIRALRIKGGR